MSKINSLIEIRPGNGGADAENFASEIATAITRGLSKTGYVVNEEPLSGT